MDSIFNDRSVNFKFLPSWSLTCKFMSRWIILAFYQDPRKYFQMPFPKSRKIASIFIRTVLPQFLSGWQCRPLRLGQILSGRRIQHTKNHYLFIFHSKMLIFSLGGLSGASIRTLLMSQKWKNAQLEQENVKYASYASNFDDVEGLLLVFCRFLPSGESFQSLKNLLTIVPDFFEDILRPVGVTFGEST